MSIYVVDGLPRVGKTSYICSPAHMRSWFKEAREDGFKIFSNIKIYVENIRYIKKYYKDAEKCIGNIESEKDRENPKKLLYYWRNINEWEWMKRGRILCQEGTRYFNARRWQMLSDDTEIKLQQHGKDRLDIWIDTQHWSRLDASLRVLVRDFCRVEPIITLGKDFTVLSRTSWHQLEELERWERNPRAFDRKEEGEEEGGEGTNYSYFIPIPLLHKPLYDTNQLVGRSRYMPLKHIVRVCEDPKCKLHKKGKISHV